MDNSENATYIGWFVPYANIFVESTSTKRRSPQAINSVIAEFGKRAGIEEKNIGYSVTENRKDAIRHMYPAKLNRYPFGHFKVSYRGGVASEIYGRDSMTTILLDDKKFDFIDVYIGENHSGIFFKEPDTITYFGLDYKDAFSKVFNALKNDCRYYLKIHEGTKGRDSYNRLKQFADDMYYVCGLSANSRRRYGL